MIIRIVKLTFQPDRVDDFLGVFHEEKKVIASFDGCERLELWEDTDNDNVFFTYSEWRDKEALNSYRNSEFFKNIWRKTKALFAEKAEAWSVNVARG